MQLLNMKKKTFGYVILEVRFMIEFVSENNNLLMYDESNRSQVVILLLLVRFLTVH